MDQWSLAESITTVIEPLYNIADFTGIPIKCDDFSKHSRSHDTLLCTEHSCDLSLKSGKFLELETQPTEDKDNPLHDLTSGLIRSTPIRSSASHTMSPGSFDGYVQYEMTAHVKQANANDTSSTYIQAAMPSEGINTMKLLAENQTNLQTFVDEDLELDVSSDSMDCNSEGCTPTKLTPMLPHTHEAMSHDACDASSNLQEPSTELQDIMYKLPSPATQSGDLQGQVSDIVFSDDLKMTAGRGQSWTCNSNNKHDLHSNDGDYIRTESTCMFDTSVVTSDFDEGMIRDVDMDEESTTSQTFRYAIQESEDHSEILDSGSKCSDGYIHVDSSLS